MQSFFILLLKSTYLHVYVSFESFSICYLLLQDAAKMYGAVLACTDEAVLPVSQVFDAIRELGNEGVEKLDPLVITSASSLSNSTSPSIIGHIIM